MHFGILSPPVPGHIHPFGALGRELKARGHRVTVFHMQDVGERIRRETLEFVPLGLEDAPPGTLEKSLRALGALDGFAALRFTIGEVRQMTALLLRHAPAAIQAGGIDALLVDQTEPAGGSIAEYLGIPFVTVCNALVMNREPEVPPAFSAWPYAATWVARWRNRLGYRLSDWALRTVVGDVQKWRCQRGLPALCRPEDSFSSRLQISQQPAEFDYPRQHLPPSFHYTGPLRRGGTAEVDFPWDRLDGRPIVYASLGTLQNGKESVFRTFAEACLHLPVQLVMTHGGGLREDIVRSFPGDPLVVPYAPQLAVLARAAMTLTHAGLNTVLDSLSCGVPLVAVPITYEQPAIAQRIVWCGAGQTIPFRQITTARVRRAVETVLNEARFRERAQRVQRSIEAAGGVRRAADLIEAACR